MRAVKSPKNFFAGLFFAAVATLYALHLSELPVGTAFRMGPGYFPLLLVLLLGGLAAILLVQGLRVEGEPIDGLRWRAPGLITFSVVFFASTVEKLGLVPALSIAVFATTCASANWSLRTSLVTTAVVVALSWAVFVRGLGLPVPSFGVWIGA